MAVPKHKVSKSRKNMRFHACFKASATTLTNCRNCHEPVRPHCVCGNCGHYKGAKRIEIKKDNAE